MLDGLRFLTDDLLQLRRMRISEYQLRMKATTLRRADKRFEMAQLALYNRRAKATDKSGKYLFTNPNQLFDLEAVVSKIYEGKQKEDEMEQTFDRLRTIAKNVQKYNSREEVKTNA